MFPATNATALPIYVLMLLAESQCYPKPRSGLVPRPTPICCPYPVTRPHYSTEKLSPIFATGNMERVGWELQETCKKPMWRPIPNGMRRKGKGKKGKSLNEPDPTTHRTMRWPIAYPSRSPTPAANKPHPTVSRLPRHPGRRRQLGSHTGHQSSWNQKFCLIVANQSQAVGIGN